MSYGAAPSIFDDPNETPTARLTRLAKQYQENYAKPALTAEEAKAAATDSLTAAPPGSIFERGIDYVRGGQDASPGRRAVADTLHGVNEYLNPLQAAYDAGAKGAQGDYLGATLAAVGAVPGFRAEGKAAEVVTDAAEAAAAKMARAAQNPIIVSPTGKPLTKTAQKALDVQARKDAEAAAKATALEGPPLTESRVSQRIPSVKGTPENVGATTDLRINTDVMRRDPEYWDKVTDAQLKFDKEGKPLYWTLKDKEGNIISQQQQRGPLTDIVPRKVATSKDPEERWASAKAIMMANLQRQYEKLDPTIRTLSTGWYPGGRKIAEDLAQKTGITREAATGNLAALSPQKDWFQNLSMGERLAYTRAEDPLISKDMVDALKTRGSAEYKKMASELDPLVGQRWSAVTNDRLAGLAAIAHDVHTREPTYRIFSPTGKQMGLSKTEAGAPEKMAWTNLANVEKAVTSLRSGGDMTKISAALGDAHKVRNFYNNLIAPRGPWNDFTNDTHNVASALLRPLSGADRLVAEGLGNAGPKSGIEGARGTYGMFADAGRAVAEKEGVLPFQIQSPTWEGVRGLFPAKAKTAEHKQAIDDIWTDFQKGELTLRQAQDKIFNYAKEKMEGDINAVPWREAQ
jgi:hypothetical protein